MQFFLVRTYSLLMITFFSLLTYLHNNIIMRKMPVQLREKKRLYFLYVIIYIFLSLHYIQDVNCLHYICNLKVILIGRAFLKINPIFPIGRSFPQKLDVFENSYVNWFISDFLIIFSYENLGTSVLKITKYNHIIFWTDSEVVFDILNIS